ncbi:exodeoxyribonuclease VII small subunit [Candidatus Saccharibacteria bacterium CG_4_10_14_0_2_um_filter_52_9]|nr:MAG: exodeoxyribonuclease VII small subunit [Candidatus Saccharibacteria bacterium CG_4_10_14_0_2_um_filter_52_9]
MTKPASTYESLKAELDGIMNELQREDLDVDVALEHYRRGLELVTALEKYLKTAENQVKEIKASFNKAQK